MLNEWIKANKSTCECTTVYPTSLWNVNWQSWQLKPHFDLHWIQPLTTGWSKDWQEEFSELRVVVFFWPRQNQLHSEIFSPKGESTATVLSPPGTIRSLLSLCNMNRINSLRLCWTRGTHFPHWTFETNIPLFPWWNWQTTKLLLADGESDLITTFSTRLSYFQIL